MASPYAPAPPPGAMFGTAAFPTPTAPGYVVTPAPAVAPQLAGVAKRTQRNNMIFVSALLFGLGLLVLLLCSSAEGDYQRVTKSAKKCLPSTDTKVKLGTCMIDTCHTKTAQGLVGTSAMLLVATVLLATVYGQCPCCCKSGQYTKDKLYYLSILFLLLLWIDFVLNFLYTITISATLTLRTEDDLCIRVAKGRIAGVGILGFLVGAFAAAHTLTVGLARAKILERDTAIPMAIPVQV